MADLLAVLAARALGVAPTLRPAPLPRFAAGADTAPPVQPDDDAGALAASPARRDATDDPLSARAHGAAAAGSDRTTGPPRAPAETTAAPLTPPVAHRKPAGPDRSEDVTHATGGLPVPPHLPARPGRRRPAVDAGAAARPRLASPDRQPEDTAPRQRPPAPAAVPSLVHETARDAPAGTGEAPATSSPEGHRTSGSPEHTPQPVVVHRRRGDSDERSESGRDRSTASPPPPHVTVSIGQVEVGVHRPAPPVAPPRPAARRAQPRLSLQDYLRAPRR